MVLLSVDGFINRQTPGEAPRYIYSAEVQLTAGARVYSDKPQKCIFKVVRTHMLSFVTSVKPQYVKSFCLNQLLVCQLNGTLWCFMS